MAKNWNYTTEDKGILVRAYKDETKSLMMDLTELYPEFVDFDEPQELYIVNGVKQKLDDAIARSKDVKLSEKEKREIQEAIWIRATVDRKYNAEGKERGQMVGLAVAVRILRKTGMTDEEIAKETKKSLESIQSVTD